MWFYQNGISRIVIGEDGNTRFQISQEDLPVVWDQLEAVNVTSHSKPYSEGDKTGIVVKDLQRTNC